MTKREKHCLPAVYFNRSYSVPSLEILFSAILEINWKKTVTIGAKNLGSCTLIKN